MKLTKCSQMRLYRLLGLGALCIACALATKAQVKTQTNVVQGEATHQVVVERGEVVYASGNDFVAKREDGQILHFDNVPESTTINVDGKQLTVHDLKPGMKVQRTTITTTTPKMITTVKTVTGTVTYIRPPSNVTLRLADGTSMGFKIPKDQKFVVGGKQLDAFGLRNGMLVSATAVTETPETEISQRVVRTGTLPPPPPQPIPANVPVLVIVSPAPVQTAAASPVPALATPAPAEQPPKSLPKTGSDLPLVGFLGALLIALGLGLKTIRTYQT